ncbi:nicotinate-nucleotide--dimethylbenzimidazole phosphoribosyltransferase [Niveibacterium sp. 24ML]|uniref:nicotinate-nucleotide--dimethylbenzimidazole phosphoribosyltransferase n=1 Tax=Niveibacterium sp. 24ML TaxID=2985512 RepID=UPI00227087B4|nr:nicotinate-nucleotide--dimethylbenzimidazole phosphoribosyltransferase [Niveibacterium sp. 24ML]MCX9154699.1 nicotinate-nucleotide--dimethylbenzimidazole phosphoribosyltransferase [Niveibacterium sp. 24ML]
MYADITAPATSLNPALQARLDGKTKPPGSLGRIEALAMTLGLIQQTTAPTVRAPHIVVFAGDHGAAKAGVSAYPQDVTWQMVANMLAGGAAINVFARQAGVTLTVVDAGVARDLADLPAQGADGTRFMRAKVVAGTASYLEAPALTADQRDTAIEAGARIVRELAAAGCNTIGFGEMGIGNTASASLITAALTGAPLADVIGRGTGLDDAGLARKRALLDQAWQRAGVVRDPLAMLAEFGGCEIAMMVGAFLEAARQKMCVVVDGFIVTSALLVADALAPAVRDYCVFAHRSQEPGHTTQLAHLKASPLLELDLRLGEGTGAALAMPLLKTACAMLAEMASFESAGVSGRDN